VLVRVIVMNVGCRTDFPIGRNSDGSGYYVEVWENGNVVWARELSGFAAAPDDDLVELVDIPDDAPTLPGRTVPAESFENWFAWQPPWQLQDAS